MAKTKQINKLNKHGFLFQLRVENEIKRGKNQNNHNHQILSSEHYWYNSED